MDIVGVHIEILPGGGVGGDHVESAVQMPDGGGKNAAAAGHLFQCHLAGAGQHMADLAPVHQILAFKEGNAGKILKATANHVIHAVCAAYAGVRVKPLQNRIVVNHSFSILRCLRMFFRQHQAQLVGCCLYFSITAVGCKADASGESGYAVLCFAMQEGVGAFLCAFCRKGVV